MDISFDGGEQETSDFRAMGLPGSEESLVRAWLHENLNQ